MLSDEIKPPEFQVYSVKIHVIFRLKTIFEIEFLKLIGQN